MYFNKGDKIKYKKGFSTFSDKDKYIFMGNCIAKNPDSGRLFSAIMYTKNGIIYVREKLNFYKTFEKI